MTTEDTFISQPHLAAIFLQALQPIVPSLTAGKITVQECRYESSLGDVVHNIWSMQLAGAAMGMNTQTQIHFNGIVIPDEAVTALRESLASMTGHITTMSNIDVTLHGAPELLDGLTAETLRANVQARMPTPA